MSTAVVTKPDLKGIVASAKTALDVVKAVGVSTERVALVEAELPKPVELTQEVVDALVALPSVFSSVVVAESRVLTGAEISSLYQEQVVLRTVNDALKGRDDAIKETIRHHMDREAEAQNRVVPSSVYRGGKLMAAATPRDRAGHYILASKGSPERVSIEGTNQAYSQEFRGGVVQFTHAAEDLLAAYETGEITREQYLAVTREQRVFDEDKALKAMSSDPETFVPIVARLGIRGADGTALFVRKA